MNDIKKSWKKVAEISRVRDWRRKNYVFISLSFAFRNSCVEWYFRDIRIREQDSQQERRANIADEAIEFPIPAALLSRTALARESVMLHLCLLNALFLAYLHYLPFYLRQNRVESHGSCTSHREWSRSPSLPRIPVRMLRSFVSLREFTVVDKLFRRILKTLCSTFVTIFFKILHVSF